MKNFEADLETVTADRNQLQVVLEENARNAAKEIEALSVKCENLVQRIQENAQQYDAAMASEKVKFDKMAVLAKVSNDNARVAMQKVAEKELLFNQETQRFAYEMEEKEATIVELTRKFDAEVQRFAIMTEDFNAKRASLEDRFRRISEIAQQREDALIAKEKLVDDLRGKRKLL